MDQFEAKFSVGMTWENYRGEGGWEMDHIYPCAKADLTKARGKRCLGAESLVPRWASEKASKGKRLNWRLNVRVIVPVPSAVEESGAEAMEGVCGWGQ